jgi:PAS domain S-box-containing protein
VRAPQGHAAPHLAAIVASSDDAIISKDLNGIITSWNRAAEQMFGYSEAEAIGKSIRMIIPSDRQAEEDHVISRIIGGQSVQHFETVRVKKDGSLIDISLSVSPIRDRDGRIIGASKIARNIAEQKHTLAALAKAESDRADLQDRLIAITAGSGSLLSSPRLADVLPKILSLAADLIAADAYAVWRLDVQQRVWEIISHAGLSQDFAVSRSRVQQGSGIFTEPVVVEDLATFSMPDERRAVYVREGIKSILAIPLSFGESGMASLTFYARRPRTFSGVELQAARALGNLAGAAMSAAELYDEQRRREIEARFLAEMGETLASSLDYRETLRGVARLAVPDIADWTAVDVIDGGGTPQRLAIAHIDPKKVAMAQEFEKRYPSNPASPYSVAHVVRTGMPAVLEYLSDEMIEAGVRDPAHRQAIRSLGITSMMCVPLRVRSGVIGAITFVSAESGRRYREHDLQFATAVATRASLAIENALSYEEAREANRLKDDFLANLSHELRTPLNAILGYTRMLRTKSVALERRDKALETVERNASALAQIVDDVLDMSRIVAGKLGVHVQPVFLPKLLEDSVSTVLPAAQAKDVHIAVKVDPDVRAIVADPDRLLQVLWNLLSNGVKFTSRGGRVDVHACRIDRDVEITVSDTGEGIAPEFLPFVFDRFRQDETRPAGVRGGLGIGLAIARHIVEMHGGTIQAASEGVGKGATFRVRLPAAAMPSERERTA